MSLVHNLEARTLPWEEVEVSLSPLSVQKDLHSHFQLPLWIVYTLKHRSSTYGLKWLDLAHLMEDEWQQAQPSSPNFLPDAMSLVPSAALPALFFPSLPPHPPPPADSLLPPFLSLGVLQGPSEKPGTSSQVLPLEEISPWPLPYGKRDFMPSKQCLPYGRHCLLDIRSLILPLPSFYSNRAEWWSMV